MAHLYQDPEWSQKDLDGPIRHAREHVAKSLWRGFVPEQLASYHQALTHRAEQGHATTIADLWGLVLESKLHGQVRCLRSSMAWSSLQVHLLRVEEALRECNGSQHLGGQGKGVQGQQRLHNQCEASLVPWGLCVKQINTQKGCEG